MLLAWHSDLAPPGVGAVYGRPKPVRGWSQPLGITSCRARTPSLKRATASSPLWFLALSPDKSWGMTGNKLLPQLRLPKNRVLGPHPLFRDAPKVVAEGDFSWPEAPDRVFRVGVAFHIALATAPAPHPNEVEQRDARRAVGSGSFRQSRCFRPRG